MASARACIGKPDGWGLSVRERDREGREAKVHGVAALDMVAMACDSLGGGGDNGNGCA